MAGSHRCSYTESQGAIRTLHVQLLIAAAMLRTAGIMIMHPRSDMVFPMISRPVIWHIIGRIISTAALAMFTISTRRTFSPGFYNEYN